MTTAYDVIVGTGGIGSGMFLALHGDRTLGREESRAATLLDQRDAGKLHIVLHYIRRLLGPQVTVAPIGMVGQDAPGRDAVAQMRDVGIDVSLVQVSACPTLFSVCFQYPNGDGGNITTANSASDTVGPHQIRSGWSRITVRHGRGIAIALPEVPIEARATLLDLATEAAFLRVSSFASQEWEDFQRWGLLERVDLLAVNLDEAAALAGLDAEAAGAADVVEAAIDRLAPINSKLFLVVTAGRRGSWAWDGQELTHAAALDVVAANTAGAGDAHLAGLVVATTCGLSLATANRYAGLVSGLAVTSRHTIDPDLTGDRVRDTARAIGWRLPAELSRSREAVSR
jgi:ribokinase